MNLSRMYLLGEHGHGFFLQTFSPYALSVSKYSASLFTTKFYIQLFDHWIGTLQKILKHFVKNRIR